jgi:hypothetical protein
MKLNVNILVEIKQFANLYKRHLLHNQSQDR